MLRTVLVLALPGVLAAQRREYEVHWGRWANGNDAASYEFRTSQPLFGSLTHGFGVAVLVNDSLGRHRAFYGMGYEVQGLRRRTAFGPYALLGVELGLSTDTLRQELAAQWSLGVGFEWRPVSGLALGAETRYRVEDRGPRGFWRPGGRRKGLSLAVGLSLGRGGGGGGGGGGGVGREGRPAASPPPEVPQMITGNAADVVRTALDALGSPYQWGGTAENGFDCSGLIQYAYAQHGVRLPRMSRDQAKAGTDVTPVMEALQAGDILLFSARPGGGVTHVGLYVGEGKFIHSSNTGVKLSRLEPHDPEGAYWIARWVGARRILQ